MTQSVKIYGCAEDALTLWALNERCDSITGSDAIDKERIIFYRPSFGRGSSNATFGEFDGIIIEKGQVFLIESKWKEKPVKTTKIILDDRQIKRHEILKWYITHWRGEENWDEFHMRCSRNLLEETGYKMPTSVNKLSKILKFILDEIYKVAGQGCNVTNILLLFHPQDTIVPRVKQCDEFQVIPMEYSPENASGFIRLIP